MPSMYLETLAKAKQRRTYTVQMQKPISARFAFGKVGNHTHTDRQTHTQTHTHTHIYRVKGDSDFRIADLVKNSDGTDI